MITVKTKLATSSIEGIGLFAAQDIKKDEVIWVLDPRTTIFYSVKQWEALKATLTETALAGFERFGYLNRGRWLLNLDDSRFMNHWETPNTYYCSETDRVLASVDITCGEELTCDYAEFDDSGEI